MILPASKEPAIFLALQVWQSERMHFHPYPARISDPQNLRYRFHSVPVLREEIVLPAISG